MIGINFFRELFRYFKFILFYVIIMLFIGFITFGLHSRYQWSFFGFTLIHLWMLISVFGLIITILIAIFTQESEVDKMMKEKVKKNPIDYSQIGIDVENKESPILNTEDGHTPKKVLDENYNFDDGNELQESQEDNSIDAELDREILEIKKMYQKPKKKELSLKELLQQYKELRKQTILLRQQIERKMKEESE